MKASAGLDLSLETTVFGINAY